MGLFNFVRPRKSVTASRADGGAAAVSAFAPPRAGAPTRPLPKAVRGQRPPSGDPTPLSSTRAPGPIDRGNSPLADEPRTEAWGAKMAGIHNTAGFIGSDGKRH